MRFHRLTAGVDWLDFADCVFVDCEFVGCRLDFNWGATTPDPGHASRFLRCSFTRCDVRHWYVKGAAFEGCTFDTCRWQAHLDEVDLVDNRFLGLTEGLTLWGKGSEAARANVVLGNDFSQADLQGLGLHGGLPVDDQLWPSSPEYVRVDRWGDRVQVLRRRLESDGDRLGLLDGLDFYSLDIDPKWAQPVRIVRPNDPAMDATWGQAVRALMETDPDS